MAGAIVPTLYVGLVVFLMHSNEQSRDWGQIVGYVVGLAALLLIWFAGDGKSKSS